MYSPTSLQDVLIYYETLEKNARPQIWDIQIFSSQTRLHNQRRVKAGSQSKTDSMLGMTYSVTEEYNFTEPLKTPMISEECLQIRYLHLEEVEQCAPMPTSLLVTSKINPPKESAYVFLNRNGKLNHIIKIN